MPEYEPIDFERKLLPEQIKRTHRRVTLPTRPTLCVASCPNQVCRGEAGLGIRRGVRRLVARVDGDAGHVRRGPPWRGSTTVGGHHVYADHSGDPPDVPDPHAQLIRVGTAAYPGPPHRQRRPIAIQTRVGQRGTDRLNRSELSCFVAGLTVEFDPQLDAGAHVHRTPCQLGGDSTDDYLVRQLTAN